MSLKTLSWPEAKKLLRECIPDLNDISPFGMLNTATKAGIMVNRSIFTWGQKPGDDSLAGVCSLWRDITPNETVLLITDYCFLPERNPFLFNVSESQTFEDEYKRMTRSMVISGDDVILLRLSSKSMLIFDHEGGVTQLEAKSQT